MFIIYSLTRWTKLMMHNTLEKTLSSICGLLQAWLLTWLFLRIFPT
jgi:hypothetical protein